MPSDTVLTHVVLPLCRLPRLIQVFFEEFLGFPSATLAGGQHLCHHAGDALQHDAGHDVVFSPVKEDAVDMAVAENTRKH